MPTVNQLNANRRNAQLSTGPRTPEGKQTAARNALQSGIYAETEVLPTERPEDLRALAAEYHQHHRPATPEARDLVDSLVRNAWRLRRFAVVEAAISAGDPVSTRLDQLQRRINATERNFHRSLKTLRELNPEPAQTPSALPEPRQPIALKPTSARLASFPQSPISAPLEVATPTSEIRRRDFWNLVDDYANKYLTSRRAYFMIDYEMRPEGLSKL